MNLTLYDTMAREKRAFVPRDPSRVTMYVCGPTVYNPVHIGNARPVVVFDILFRLLRQIYGEDAVIYARNITDVDDKINAKAQAEGVPIKTITERYTAIYQADMAALGALTPSLQPRATDHIADMVRMISQLIERGCAYPAESHVLFDTQSFADYGQLSGRPLDEMIAGARVDVAPYKRHPADFVLWKPSKAGEPAWESPWGEGRPGWHIECSAMIEAVLGLPIDIHAGGIDLVFPHHENELAQGRCAHDSEAFANYWLHNGFLDMAGVKMSKSLGNVIIPHELLQTTPGEAVRWALASAHYRQPLDWTPELIEQAKKSLDRLYQVLQDADRELAEYPAVANKAVDEAVAAAGQGVFDALCNDLNTPQAQSELFQIAQALRASLSVGQKDQAYLQREALRRSGALIGLLQSASWFEGGADADLKAKIEGLLKSRLEARHSKDWATADRIRNELDAIGVVVMDGPEGATWRMKD
jgi:cysteinyl-tRNA synthetase